MATSNGTGASPRLNPSPVGAPAGDSAPGAQERAWLAGTQWLTGLTTAERAKVFATFGAAPTATDEASDYTRDAERLCLVNEAGRQIEELTTLLIKAGVTGDTPDGILGILIRVNDLSGAVIFGLTDGGDDIDHLHQQVRGRRRAIEGAAS